MCAGGNTHDVAVGFVTSRRYGGAILIPTAQAATEIRVAC
jgi:hypothetical protein